MTSLFVENVLAKFRRIQETASASPQQYSVGVESWLTDDVSPLVDGLQKDFRFRDAATWPLESLGSDSDSQVREDIDCLDAAMVELAGELIQLDWNAGPATPTVTSLMYSAEPVARKLPLADLVHRVRSASSRPWFDLVEQGDYLNPHGTGLFIAEPSRFPELRLNPQLSWGTPVLGDLVTRCMLHRIEFWEQAVSTLCLRSNQMLGPENRELGNRLFDLQLELQRRHTRVSEQCNQHLNNMPEACIVLTQVYIAFGKDPNVSWLELANGTIECQRQFLPQFVTRPTVNPDAMDRIVWALEQCRTLLTTAPDPDEVITKASREFQLVVDLSSKTILWKGERLHNPLLSSSWDFFSALVEARKLWKRGIDFHDVDGPSGNYKAFKVQKKRLVDSLSGQFGDLAKSIVADGNAYTLSVDPADIAIFSRSVREEIYRLDGRRDTRPQSIDIGQTTHN